MSGREIYFLGLLYRPATRILGLLSQVLNSDVLNDVFSSISIDILYTLDSASNYFAIQKLKPCLQTQDIPMK